MDDSAFKTFLHHTTLEKKLIDLFPEDLFQKLSLPMSTYPLISQGLPRDFNVSSSTYLHIKTGFNDFDVLKRRIIDKAVLNTYKGCSSREKKKIILLTYVVPGGLGDYFAQKFIKKKITSLFPYSEIYSISFLHHTAPHLSTNEKNDLCIRYSHQNELHPLQLPTSVIQLLNTASFILQIPTPYPYWQELQSHLKKEEIRKFQTAPEIETVGEYGFIQSEGYLPTSDTRCLGLHFLEYGLLIENQKERTLAELSQKPLISLLLGKNSFTEYKKNSHLYFSYLYTDYGHTLYLYGLLSYLNDDSKDLDIVSTDIGPFLKGVEKNVSMLDEYRIQKIEIYYKNHYSCINVKNSGKKVRIIHTGTLSHDDFMTLLKASEEPVGVRGNLSFSEAISMNKAYFYDPLTHNLPLYYELLSIAKEKAPDAFEFIKLFKKRPNLIDSINSFAKTLKNSDALNELKNLNTFIQTRFSAMTHLENLTHRALYHHLHPETKEKERSLIALYMKEKLSFDLLIKKLRQLV